MLVHVGSIVLALEVEMTKASPTSIASLHAPQYLDPGTGGCCSDGYLEIQPQGIVTVPHTLQWLLISTQPLKLARLMLSTETG